MNGFKMSHEREYLKVINTIDSDKTDLKFMPRSIWIEFDSIDLAITNQLSALCGTWTKSHVPQETSVFISSYVAYYKICTNTAFWYNIGIETEDRERASRRKEGMSLS